MFGFTRCPGAYHRQISAGPGQTVWRIELQAFGGKLKSVSQQSPTHPASNRSQCQWCQIFAKLHLNVLKRNIQRCTANQSLVNVYPGAKAAISSFGMDTKGVDQVGPDLRHIANLLEVGVHLARPVREVASTFGQQRLPENTPQAKSLTPTGRRRGVQSKSMPSGAVFKRHVYLLQLQHRRFGQLICPAHNTALDSPFRLREKPVSGGAAVTAFLINIQPANVNLAIQGAADIQHRLVNDQLLKPAF